MKAAIAQTPCKAKCAACRNTSDVMTIAAAFSETRPVRQNELARLFAHCTQRKIAFSKDSLNLNDLGKKRQLSDLVRRHILPYVLLYELKL